VSKRHIQSGDFFCERYTCLCSKEPNGHSLRVINKKMDVTSFLQDILNSQIISLSSLLSNYVLASLPSEVCSFLLSHLHLSSFVPLSCTCKLFYDILSTRIGITHFSIEYVKERDLIPCLKRSIKAGHVFISRNMLCQRTLYLSPRQGDMLMRLAIREGHLELVKLLAIHGVDMIVFHTTNVLLASSLGNVEMVKYFLEIKQATPSVTKKAFLEACSHGHVEVAQFFLPSIDNNTQQEGLLLGCTYNFSNIVKLLLSHNIDPSFFSNAPISCSIRRALGSDSYW